MIVVVEWGALRETVAEVEGRATPVYGLVTAVGVALPLVVGAVSGHAAQGGLVALGAFYVAFTAPNGPYGARARSLLTAVVVVTAFTWLGGLLSGEEWWAVAVVPVIAAFGAVLPWVGPTASMCTVLAAVRPTGADAFTDGLLEMVGGLLITVLFLAPWMTHRLRPMRTALADTARAVGLALDVLAAPEFDGHEWDRLRGAAADSIESARGTYGLYRTGGRDDRPRRLIDAFERLLTEGAAMRSLLAGTRRVAVPEEWERERRVAVSALAARVRLLAGAIDAGGGMPLGSAEPLAVRRFMDLTDELRHSTPDLVLAALVVQVRRTVTRMARTVDTTSQIAGRGLTLGFDAPRLPERPAPWSRFRTAVATRSPGLRHGARVAVAVAVSMALAAGLNLQHGHWLTITVLLCLRDSYGDTVTRTVKRVGGTVVGASLAAVALAIAPGEMTLVVSVFVCGVLGFTLRSVNYAYWMIFGTPMVMLLVDFSATIGWTAAAARIGLTLAGAVIALAAARLLWPGGATDRLPGQLDRLLGTHARLIRAVAGRFDGDDGDDVYAERLTGADEAAVAVDATADRLGQEPAPPDALLRQLREIGVIARRMRDYLSGMAVLPDDDPADAGPIPDILERLADHLEGDPLDLDDLLTDLDDHLSKVSRRRRAELADGVATGDLTPLRGSLLQGAGARHALRVLANDTERLRVVIDETA